ncbi:hypothetical protein IWQ61_000956 [Dispira simplex]|nr:hypothetical protein IWQ61_000956 [Dispira simplex]
MSTESTQPDTLPETANDVSSHTTPPQEKLTKKRLKALQFRKKVAIEKQKKDFKPEPEPETNDATENTEAQEALEPATTTSPTPSSETKPKMVRHILFIGNLPYDITQDELAKHFHNLSHAIHDIRLVTDPDTGKGKGYAFLDVTSQKAFKNALALHHSKLRQRRINVERTSKKTEPKKRRNPRKDYQNSVRINSR